MLIYQSKKAKDNGKQISEQPAKEAGEQNYGAKGQRKRRAEVEAETPRSQRNRLQSRMPSKHTPNQTDKIMIICTTFPPTLPPPSSPPSCVFLSTAQTQATPSSINAISILSALHLIRTSKIKPRAKTETPLNLRIHTT